MSMTIRRAKKSFKCEKCYSVVCIGDKYGSWERQTICQPKALRYCVLCSGDLLSVQENKLLAEAKKLHDKQWRLYD